MIGYDQQLEIAFGSNGARIQGTRRGRQALQIAELARTLQIDGLRAEITKVEQVRPGFY